MHGAQGREQRAKSQLLSALCPLLHAINMKHNLKITLRNAKKNGVISFAKVFGLSLSFAVVMFAAAFVYFETSFDNFMPDKDRIYRVYMKGILNGHDFNAAVTNPNMAGAMLNDIPEVEETVRLRWRGNAVFTYKNKSFRGRETLVLVDSNFFSFFGYPYVSNLENPFESKNYVAISKSLAEKYFGSVEDALDKRVILNKESSFISAVFDDVPKNSHLNFDVLQSIENVVPASVSWNDGQSYYTYFKTMEPVKDLDALGFTLTSLVYRYTDNRIDGATARNWEDLKYHPENYLFYLAETLTDVHFSFRRFSPARIANKTYVYGAAILAILVLLISTINYVNLSMASISTRLKEIALRKTTGALSKQISIQFMGETLLFWGVSFIFAVFIYLFSSPYLMNFIDLEFSISNKVLFKLLGLSFAVLLAFNLLVNYLSIQIISKQKVLSLFENKSSAGKLLGTKNLFVFIQFILSGVIILAAVTVNKQINYLVNKDKGYDSSNVMMITLWDLPYKSRQSFIEELKSYPVIENVACANEYFGADPGMNSAYFESIADANYFHTTEMTVDKNFVETFDIKLKEGRFFAENKLGRYNEVIINEAVVRDYTGKGSLIDKIIIIRGDPHKVIGIVKDFNFRSLHYKIAPLVISHNENLGSVFVKINQKNQEAAVVTLKELWGKYNIKRPFWYTFHDEVLAGRYADDMQAKRLMMVLSIISILIASIGLYAISYFTILRKTKEFAIRKINGASIVSITTNLSQQFLVLVVSAFVLAIPFSVLFIRKWLNSFAYQTALDWWMFAMAIIITIAIASLSILWHVIKAAVRNPVEALRYE